MICVTSFIVCTTHHRKAVLLVLNILLIYRKIYVPVLM